MGDVSLTYFSDLGLPSSLFSPTIYCPFCQSHVPGIESHAPFPFSSGGFFSKSPGKNQNMGGPRPGNPGPARPRLVSVGRSAAAGQAPAGRHGAGAGAPTAGASDPGKSGPFVSGKTNHDTLPRGTAHESHESSVLAEHTWSVLVNQCWLGGAGRRSRKGGLSAERGVVSSF